MKKQRKRILSYIKAQEIDRALEEALDFLKYEEDSKILFYTGYCYYIKKQFKESVIYYKKSLELSDSKEDRLDVYKGLSKIYIQYDYLYISNKDREEIEPVLLSIIENSQRRDYSEVEYESILFMCNIYLYNDIDRYLGLFNEYCVEGEGDRLEMKEQFKEKGYELIRIYFMEKIRIFEKDLKDLKNSGVFSLDRKILKKRLEEIVNKCTGAEKYYSVLYEKYLSEFIQEINGLYVLFLTIRIYADYANITDLLEFINELMKNKIEIEDKSLVLMVLSDFVNIPAVLGDSSSYKSIYYNTLSPTISLLRFPKDKKNLLGIYDEIEKVLNTDYSLKKEYVHSLILNSRTEEEVLTNREYSMKGAIDEYCQTVPEDQRKRKFLSHPRNRLIFLENSMRSMNIQVTEDILENRREEKMEIDGAMEVCMETECIIISTELGLEKRKDAEYKKGKTEKIEKDLLQIVSKLYSIEYFKKSLFRYTIDSILSKYLFNAICHHMNIIGNRVSLAHTYLKESEDGIDRFRQYLIETEAYDDAFDKIYSYHRFLCEYINKIIDNQNTDSKSDEPDYLSIYSREYLRKKDAAGLPRLSLYKYIVRENIEYFRHLLAINNYENNKKSLSLVLLKEIYENNPYNYYLINDLGIILSENSESIIIIDKYLREVQNINSKSLLSISMSYHKKQKNWEIVERRAKEILALEYEYKIKMALVHALTEQKKYKYAIKILLEIENKETENITDKESKYFTERTISIKIFLIFLYIKIGKIEEALDISTSALKDHSITGIKRDKLIQYTKYIYSLKLNKMISTGEIEHVLEIAEEYRNIEQETETEHKTEIDRIISITDTYSDLIYKILKKDTGAENRLNHSLSTDDQNELITVSKLLLILASINNSLNNPSIHNTISCCIKKANLQGETKEALEVELLLRIIRDEEVKEYYKEGRKSEETPFARVLLSIMYDPGSLAGITREYLKNTTVMDMPLLEILAKTIAAQNNPRDTADLEAIYLHLCRKYTANSTEVRWLHNLLKNTKKEKKILPMGIEPTTPA